jgi:hypothetical protein
MSRHPVSQLTKLKERKDTLASKPEPPQAVKEKAGVSGGFKDLQNVKDKKPAPKSTDPRSVNMPVLNKPGPLLDSAGVLKSE